MILDTLQNADRYVVLGESFKKAFAFLRRPDANSLEAGRHEIDGEQVYAIVASSEGREKEKGQLETHNKYTDIQYVVSGIDEMGWKQKSACKKPCADYDGEKDVQLFNDTPDAWIQTGPGAFTVFFPSDAHMPLIGSGIIHKIVVKILDK